MGWEPSQFCVWPSLSLHLWRSAPFPLCIPRIPVEAALLGGEKLTLQVIYGFSHHVTHWHFPPTVSWVYAAPHPATNSLEVLEQRRDMPPVEFEDLSHRRCDTSSPRIWKVWLSFAVLFPLILWILSRCQHGGWNSTVGFCSVTVPESEKEK